MAAATPLKQFSNSDHNTDNASDDSEEFNDSLEHRPHPTRKDVMMNVLMPIEVYTFLAIMARISVGRMTFVKFSSLNSIGNIPGLA